MKNAEEKEGTGKNGRRTRKEPAKRVEELLWALEQKLRADEFKPTVADFIRLLQLHKEFGSTKPRKLEVTWIDPPKPADLDAA
jgi:hypothetical protein